MQLGLVVHPTRDMDRVLTEIRAWASSNDATYVPTPVRVRRCAVRAAPFDCRN